LILCYAASELINFLFILSAIATVVTVAEILKNNGLAVEKSKIHVTLLFVDHVRIFLLSSYSIKLALQRS
jgi:acyl CoA:acetate/3-ketoacid CoA transferase alpha subunit